MDSLRNCKTLCIIIFAITITGCQYSFLKEKKVTAATTHFSEQDIEDIVEVVLDELPSVTNRKLQDIPELKFVSTEELVAVLLNEEDDSKELENLQRYSKAVSAVYDHRTNSVYVVPNNIHVLGDNLESIKHNTYYSLLVTISHELVHALQHQEVDFSKRYVTNTTPELSRTYQLIVEGHAVLQTALLLKKMGLLKDIEKFPQTDKENLLTIDFTDQDQQDYNAALNNIYIQGKNFFDYHYKRGGNELTWNILKNPPNSTSVVLNPEKYNVNQLQ